MNNLFGGTKDKKFLFFAVATSVVLTTAVFLFVYLSDRERQRSIIGPAETEGKSMEELKKEFSTPVNPDIGSVNVSDDFRKSLSVPVEAKKDTAADLKNKKNIQATPAPIPASVSKSFIDSLNQPVK